MNEESILELKRSILLQLLYSEIFLHPLSKDELILFASQEVEAKKLNSCLAELQEQGLIQEKDSFFYVNEENNKIELRVKGSENASRLMSKAQKTAQFIHSFPFIKGVGISGSLSKGVLHSDSDFDFFIITKPNRLWIARTILILYKKIFLFNSRKFFCVNYFVDFDNLEIEEKNRFTAVEIATLIPASGIIFEEFYNQNQWVENYFPNYQNNKVITRSKRKPWWSRFLEFVFKGKFGEWMDQRMMKTTLKRWKKKFGDFNNEKFNLTMKSRKYVSKHHPNDFQSKVLKKHENLIKKYKVSFATELKKENIEL